MLGGLGQYPFFVDHVAWRLVKVNSTDDDAGAIIEKPRRLGNAAYYTVHRRQPVSAADKALVHATRRQVRASEGTRMH